MDIEGAEGVVLKESRHMLKNVHYIFCEYHYIQNSTENELEDILQILDDEGFEYQVSKSWSYSRSTKNKPVNYVGNPYIGFILAKNKLWS